MHLQRRETASCVFSPAAPHASARVAQQNGEDMVDNDITENIIHDKLLNDKLRTNLGYVYELPPYYRVKRVETPEVWRSERSGEDECLAGLLYLKYITNEFAEFLRVTYCSF